VNSLDHLAIDEGNGWRAANIELDAALALDDRNIEGAVSLEEFLAVVNRKTLYKPPWLVSSSLATSVLDSTSSRPSGEIRVSTTS
jgi:hypothetical protein